MKPSISKVMINRKIREVLNIRPGFGKTEKFLLEAVNELTGGGVSLQELRDGIEWNHAKTYIRSKFEDEAEETLWFITPDGIAQQHI